MKGNQFTSGFIKDIEIASNKTADIIDTSSVFHSSCSTLNCSKQDTAYEDNSSLSKSANYKKTLFCNKPFIVDNKEHLCKSLIPNSNNVVLGKKRINLEQEIETPKKKISTIIKIPKCIKNKLPCQSNNTRKIIKLDEQCDSMDTKMKKLFKTVKMLVLERGLSYKTIHRKLFKRCLLFIKPKHFISVITEKKTKNVKFFVKLIDNKQIVVKDRTDIVREFEQLIDSLKK